MLSKRALTAVLVTMLLLCCCYPCPVALASAPYLCKCTCFSTNTTILPLYAPVDPSNPCNTCTREYCIEQSLKECRGARIEKPDADTGTGWEGEVWARCFQRDSGKDQTIVTLYLFTVLVLLAAAALRNHIAVWTEEYRSGGAVALGRALQASWANFLSRLPFASEGRFTRRRR